MQTLSEIRQLLESRGLAPRKSLGQNFLIDHNLIRKLVDASGVRTGDLVLEVGPGTGALTEELLERGCEVVACELDRGLAQLLRERFGDRGSRNDLVEAVGTGRVSRATRSQNESAEALDTGRDARATKNFTLIEGDCLEGKRHLNPEAAARVSARPFRLVANLPYGAATPLITTLLSDYPNCSSLHVTIQREVAERIAARPGGREYGALSVISQAAAEISSVGTLPPECFWPRPEVTSAMISLTRRGTPRAEIPRLAAFCARAFSQRRKQLGSVLGRDFPFPEGFDPRRRAEELSVDELIALANRAPSGMLEPGES